MATKSNPPGWDARLADAKKKAKARTDLGPAVGPDWPNPDNVDLDAALAELTVAMYMSGDKVSFGCMNDGSGIWGRITCPASSDEWQAGKVAFTVSDTLDKVVRKLVQLLESESDRVWKPDQFARGTEAKQS